MPEPIPGKRPESTAPSNTPDTDDAGPAPAYAADLADALREELELELTGIIELSPNGAGRTFRAHFVDGHAAAIETDDPAASLGRFLVRDGLLTDAQERAAVAITARIALTLEELLAVTAAVRPEQLDATRDRWCLEVMMSALLDERRVLRVEPGPTPEPTPGDVSLTPQRLLEELRRRARTTGALRQRFGGRDLTAERLADRGGDADLLDSDERRVLAVLDRRRSASDVCVLAGLGRWRGLQALDSLAGRGTIRLSDAEPPPARDAADAGADPDASAAAIALGRKLMEMHQFAEGVEAFRTAVDFCPDNPMAWELLEEANRYSCFTLYENEFPADTQFHVCLEAAQASMLTPSDVHLLSRLEGESSVRAAIASMPIAELDALLALKRLKEAGFLTPE